MQKMTCRTGSGRFHGFREEAGEEGRPGEGGKRRRGCFALAGRAGQAVGCQPSKKASSDRCEAQEGPSFRDQA